jgi:membrane-bound metal-dependent hydrolase YbcI (DUF457 family)
MFIGHFALGFAAKRAAPRISLGTLFAASQLPDLVWPVLVGLGIEQVRIAPGTTPFTALEFVSYPYSHSLLFVAIWGLAFGGLYGLRLHGFRSVAVVTVLVVSHWVLDWVTHRPDMPLYPGSSTFGLGLWYSVPGTILVESTLFVAGTWSYARLTRPRDTTGRWAFITLVVLLVVAYVANIVGGPPPSIDALWMGALAGIAIILAVALWVDGHRTL